MIIVYAVVGGGKDRNMKMIVHKYRISKFKRFANGLLFAVISAVSLTLCLTDIYNTTAVQTEIMLPFGVGILSMLIGFFTMFRTGNVPKEKI